jgi:hypothetical protein
MIRLADILKNSEYAHYRNLRYGLTEQFNVEPMIPPSAAMGQSGFGHDADQVMKQMGQDIKSFAAGPVEYIKDTWLWKYRHELLMLLEFGVGIASFWFPPLWLLSSGFALTNSFLYSTEGDYRQAGMFAIFAMLPGIGPMFRTLKVTPYIKLTNSLKAGNAAALNWLDRASLKAYNGLAWLVTRLGGAKQFWTWAQNNMLQKAFSAAGRLLKPHIDNILGQLNPMALQLGLRNSIKLTIEQTIASLIKGTLKGLYNATKLAIGGASIYGLITLYNHVFDKYYLGLKMSDDEYKEKVKKVKNKVAAVNTGVKKLAENIQNGTATPEQIDLMDTLIAPAHDMTDAQQKDYVEYLSNIDPETGEFDDSALWDDLESEEPQDTKSVETRDTLPADKNDGQKLNYRSGSRQHGINYRYDDLEMIIGDRDTYNKLTPEEKTDWAKKLGMPDRALDIFYKAPSNAQIVSSDNYERIDPTKTYSSWKEHFKALTGLEPNSQSIEDYDVYKWFAEIAGQFPLKQWGMYHDGVHYPEALTQNDLKQQVQDYKKKYPYGIRGTGSPGLDRF